MKTKIGLSILGLSFFYLSCSSGSSSPESLTGSGGSTVGTGNTAGTGGTGEGNGENTGGYPDYLNSIETHTSPEAMDLVNCMVEKNKELQSSEQTGIIRAGIVMMGGEQCYECKEERDEIGQEGVVKLAINGIYVDPFFNFASEQRARDVGWLCFPSITVIKNDPFPTTENPEGIETLLKRHREGFNSLQTLADLTGCTYDP